jgi:hypothetical protein
MRPPPVHERKQQEEEATKTAFKVMVKPSWKLLRAKRKIDP